MRQVEERVALHTFKVSTELNTDFRGEKGTVHKVSYPEELAMPRSDFRGSTVFIFLTYRAGHNIICWLDFKINSVRKKLGDVDKFICPKINYKKA